MSAAVSKRPQRLASASMGPEWDIHRRPAQVRRFVMSAICTSRVMTFLGEAVSRV